MPQIKVDCIPVGPIAANCYVVENLETGECLIVDPGDESERIIRLVGSRKPQAVLLTHGHYDHIGAVDAMCSHFDIPVYLHELEADKLSDAEKNLSTLFSEAAVQHTQPRLLHADERITLAGIELEVLHTPGHSAGCVCYRLPDAQGMLTGDTLFANGYGRTDFYDGDFHQLYQSLRRLMRLTPKMVTYPGHDVPGTVGRDPVEEA